MTRRIVPTLPDGLTSKRTLDVAEAIEVGLVVAEVPGVQRLAQLLLHVFERISKLDAVNAASVRRVQSDVVQDLVAGEEEIEPVALQPPAGLSDTVVCLPEG